MSSRHKDQIRQKNPYNLKSTPKPKIHIKVSNKAEEVFERIKITFNVHEMRKLSENDYVYVKKQLIKRSYIFEQLIYNLEMNTLQPIRFISGPNYFNHMKHQMKDIYLIGERHKTIKTCEKYKYENHLNFYDFSLRRLVQYDDIEQLEEDGYGKVFDYVDITEVINDIMSHGFSYVDLFVEIDPFHYLQTSKITPLNKDDRITDITMIGKNMPVGRTHLVDIRGSPRIIDLDKTYNPSIQFSLALNVLVNKAFNSNIKKRYAPIFIKYYEYLYDNSLSDLEWVERMIDFVLDNGYLQKELKRSYLGDTILRHFEKNMRQSDILKERYSQMEEVIEEIKKTNKASGKNLQILREFEQDFIDLYVPLVDMYIMARVFKRFLGLDFDRPNEPRNIIIYTGAVHSENMAIFLAKIGFSSKMGERIAENCVYTIDDQIFFDN